MSPALLQYGKAHVQNCHFDVCCIHYSMGVEPTQNSVYCPCNGLRISSGHRQCHLLCQMGVDLKAGCYPRQQHIRDGAHRRSHFIERILRCFFCLVTGFFQLVDIVLDPSQKKVDRLIPFAPDRHHHSRQFTGQQKRRRGIGHFLVDGEHNERHFFHRMVQNISIQLFFKALVQQCGQFLPYLGAALKQCDQITVASDAELL